MPLNYSNTQPKKIKYNNVDAKSVVYNGKTVWTSQPTYKAISFSYQDKYTVPSNHVVCAVEFSQQKEYSSLTTLDTLPSKYRLFDDKYISSRAPKAGHTIYCKTRTENITIIHELYTQQQTQYYWAQCYSSTVRPFNYYTIILKTT